MARTSRIDIPGTTNLRDVGGLPAAGGTVVRAGRLYRAEVLVATTTPESQGVWREDQAAAYAALGVRTVVDLRAEHEAAAKPTAWGLATGAELVALPIAEGGEGSDTNYVRLLLSGELARFGPEEMAAFYRDTLDRRATTFAAAVRVLADPDRVPVLVHCSAGKDRTGLLVALVLDLLGTPRTAIVDDYTLTGVLRPDRVLAYADLFGPAGVDLDDVRGLFETPASAMEAALGHLDARYGGTEPYLVGAGGLAPAEIAAVRSNLLVPDEPDAHAPRP